MKDILVVGIGSRVMMDDGIGIYLVEDLKSHFVNSNLKFVVGETDIDYCLSKISEANSIIIIDAFLSGKNPGEITVASLSDLRKENNINYSLHGIHILELIQCFKKEVNGILIGIEPYEVNYSLYLSDTLKGLYPGILKSVCKHINSLEGNSMHDTFLLKRISENLNELCSTNQIIRVNKLHLITNPNSHINQNNLYEHLKEHHVGLIGEWTNIIIDRRDIKKNTAVIESIEGDTCEQ